MRILLLVYVCVGWVLTTALAVPAAAAVYYVAPTGSDSAAGTAAQPLRTVGAAAGRAEAGDLVVVTAGVYREAIVLTHSGQKGAPIVLRGLPGAVLESPDSSRSLSAFDIGASIAFVTIQGFDLGGGFDETVFIRSGAHDIELAGLHIHNNHTGIWIGGATDVFVHDCRIDHNYRTGIRMFDGAQRIHIADTRAEYNDDGAGCDGASDGFNTEPSVTDVIFERASAIGNSQDGFDLKGPNATLLGVTAQDNGCSGIKLWAGGYVENAVVQGHTIGVNVGAPAGGMTVVQNCTVSQNGIGVRALTSTQTVIVRDSIISGDGKAISYASPVQLIENHNVLYRPSATERLIVQSTPSGDVLYTGNDINTGRWQHASGQGEGTVAADPRLDPIGAMPAADSPAIDRADAQGSPVIDRVGTPRPQGHGVDCGAVERPVGSISLRLQRLAFHGGGTGAGPLRVLAQLGREPDFDLSTDTLEIWVRSSRGEMAHATVAPNAWTVSTATDGMLPRLLHADSVERLRHAKLSMDTRGVRFWLTVSAADLWACDGSMLTVTVQLGANRTSADVPLEALGTLMVGESGRRPHAPHLR